MRGDNLLVAAFVLPDNARHALAKPYMELVLEVLRSADLVQQRQAHKLMALSGSTVTLFISAQLPKTSGLAWSPMDGWYSS